jgi:hypothetical protein
MRSDILAAARAESLERFIASIPHRSQTRLESTRLSTPSTFLRGTNEPFQVVGASASENHFNHVLLSKYRAERVVNTSSSADATRRSPERQLAMATRMTGLRSMSLGRMTMRGMTTVGCGEASPGLSRAETQSTMRRRPRFSLCLTQWRRQAGKRLHRVPGRRVAFSGRRRA